MKVIFLVPFILNNTFFNFAHINILNSRDNVDYLTNDCNELFGYGEAIFYKYNENFKYTVKNIYQITIYKNSVYIPGFLAEVNELERTYSIYDLADFHAYFFNCTLDLSKISSYIFDVNNMRFCNFNDDDYTNNDSNELFEINDGLYLQDSDTGGINYISYLQDNYIDPDITYYFNIENFRCFRQSNLGYYMRYYYHDYDYIHGTYADRVLFSEGNCAVASLFEYFYNSNNTFGEDMIENNSCVFIYDKNTTINKHTNITLDPLYDYGVTDVYLLEEPFIYNDTQYESEKRILNSSYLNNVYKMYDDVRGLCIGSGFNHKYGFNMRQYGTSIINSFATLYTNKINTPFILDHFDYEYTLNRVGMELDVGRSVILSIHDETYGNHSVNIYGYVMFEYKSSFEQTYRDKESMLRIIDDHYVGNGIDLTNKRYYDPLNKDLRYFIGEWYDLPSC